MDTADLVQQAREGDDAAYEALFARVGERLLLYLRVRLGQLASRIDPLDALQEVYLAAHRDFPRFRSAGGAFVGWLFRIADHRLLDLVDHHGAQKRKPAGGWAGTSATLHSLRASHSGPATTNERREEQERVASALSALPEDERQVILLHHFHEHSLQEVAAETGRSVKAVRTLLARARYRLGGALEDPAGRAG